MISSVVQHDFARTWERRPRTVTELLSFLTVAYCVVLPFDIVPGVLGRSLAFPLLGALLIVWGVAMWKGEAAASIDVKILVLAATFVGWCLTTVVWSVAPEVTLVSGISHVLQILTVMALSVSIPDRIPHVLGGLTHGTVVMGILILLASPDPARDGRTSIFGVDENITGMVLAIGFSAAVCCAMTRSRKRASLLYLLEAGVIAGAIVKGGSRSAFVAVALVLLATAFLLLIGSRGVGWRVRAMFLASLVCGPMVLYVTLRVLGLVPERIQELVSAPFRQGDSLRGEITSQYRETFDVWVWRGVGFGADDEYLVSTGLGTQNVHQMFWRIWVEVGVVGLILFCLFLIGVFAVSVRRRTALTQTILLSVPVAFFALTLGGTDRTTIFWFVIAFAVAGTGRSMTLRTRRRSEPQIPIGREPGDAPA